MNRGEILDRAKSAIGNGTIYRLGGGAPYTSPHPWDEQQSCDCSGFVLWVLGLPRHVTTFSWLTKLNGGWLNTDGMVEDSLQPTGFFTRVTPGTDRSTGVLLNNVRPGDLIVYPSAAYARARGLLTRGQGVGPRIGHVGIITYGSAGTATHCSNGNYKRVADAIQDTNLDVFKAVPYHSYLRFSGVE